MFYRNGLWNDMGETIPTTWLFAELFNIRKFTIYYSPHLRPVIDFTGDKVSFGLGKKDTQVLYEIISLVRSIKHLYICANLPYDLLVLFTKISENIHLPTSFGIPGYAIINSNLDEIFYIVDSLPRNITKLRITNIEPGSERTWRSLWRKLKEFTNLQTLVINKKPNRKLTISNECLLLNINKFDTNIQFDIDYFLKNSKTTNLSCCLGTYTNYETIHSNKYLVKSYGLRIIGDNRPILESILHRNAELI